MDEDKFEQGKDLIEDSLELCADITRYYEAEEMDRLDFNGYINRKNKPDKNISDKTEIVVINQTDEESGLKLYTKIVAIILFAMVFARIINAYIVQETIVNGSSMNPTLESSDKVLIDKIIYKIDKLNRYDIVVFDYHHSSVYVNGKILKDDPRIKDTMHYAGIARDGVELGKDEYFVLGDNRNNSYDSRYEEVGVVNKSSMIGKVWIRIFPILKFGAVN